MRILIARYLCNALLSGNRIAAAHKIITSHNLLQKSIRHGIYIHTHTNTHTHGTAGGGRIATKTKSGTKNKLEFLFNWKFDAK